MGKLIVANKAAHDELRKLSGRIIKASILIEPLILEDDRTVMREPYSLLGVRIICGTDEPYDQMWLPHQGEKEGPQWEESKLFWLHLYQYIKDYIGAMITLGATQLTHEAPYLRLLDNDKLKTIFDTSADLKRFYEALGTIYKAGVPHDSEFQMWIGQFAYGSQRRLTGETKVSIGSDTRLRFSPAEMKRLLEIFPEEQRIWQRARDIFWANESNPNWRQIVMDACPNIDKNNINCDDLLEAVSQRTEKGEFKYRPVQVAVVSAARRASFDNKEQWYSPPSMAQHRMIGRAMNEWRKRFDEAKQLNLRW
jgi:hypothetical protein